MEFAVVDRLGLAGYYREDVGSANIEQTGDEKQRRGWRQPEEQIAPHCVCATPGPLSDSPRAE